MTATRKILSHRDGSQPRAVTNLPYQPPGLRWQGSDAITQSQLQSEVQQRIGRQQKKNKNFLVYRPSFYESYFVYDILKIVSETIYR